MTGEAQLRRASKNPTAVEGIQREEIVNTLKKAAECQKRKISGKQQAK